jgi:hypothetical protein
LTTQGYFTSAFVQILGRIFWPDFSRSGLDNPPPLKTAKDQKQQDARHPDIGADILAGFFQIWAG